ncbi:KICSTOR complex protein kaptin-like [Littorina saxatilis]|uniref:KICSTOR complex protein kaptin n=1 Tax=Littorina saxatilis TaxID=31220 RepID=A0AAN9BEN2_9CAEN
MESQKVFEWTDAHFCSLSSQTNIYGMQKLRTEKNTKKFLVSSLDSSFLSVEYQKIGDRVTPLTKGIQFAHIPVPGDAEIVSISAFERLPPRKGLVVGITYVMLQEQEAKPKTQVLNIYSAVLTEEEDDDSGKENKLEIVADSCQSNSLTFIPFILTNTEVTLEDGRSEPVFLLSGSDFKIHVYQEQPLSPLGVMEVPSENFFPEFQDLACNVLQLEITKPVPHQRLTALGFEDGTIRLHLVDTRKNEMLKDWSAMMDSPVTSLHFFTQQKIVPIPPCLENASDDASQNSNTEEDAASLKINLLMTTALEPAVVYRDVMTHGLSEFLSLPNSEKYDSALCSLAADIDFDGQHELLVGTYGQELLTYKFYPTAEKWVPVSPPELAPHNTLQPMDEPTNGNDSPQFAEQCDESGKQRHKSDEGEGAKKGLEHRKVKSQEDLMSWMGDRNLHPDYSSDRTDQDPLELRTVPEPHYKLLWQHSFPCPLMGLDSAEMMGDGIENLVVLTTHGLHVMQPDMNEVAQLIENRMLQMVASGPDAGDEFHKLQVE